MITHDEVMEFVLAHRKDVLPCQSFAAAAKVVRPHADEQELAFIAHCLQYGDCKCAVCKDRAIPARVEEEAYEDDDVAV